MKRDVSKTECIGGRNDGARASALLRALATAMAAATAVSMVACAETTATDEEPLGTASDEITCTTFIRGGVNGGVTDAPIAFDSADPTQGGSNFGSALLLQTGALGTNVKQSLVRFDLSVIPAGAIVTSGTLTLLKQASPGNGIVEIHRATSAWSESTVTWNTFGGAIDSSILGSINSAVSPNGQPVSIDLTGLAQQWVNGAVANDGIVLTQPGPGRTTFGASEAGNFGPRPKLVVCYAPPNCTDGVQNGLETGVDCGGACPNACQTCSDGIQNQGETGVDCGGPCAACPVVGGYGDWLVGTACNGVDYGGGCTPTETGYHYKGYFNGYACWWHTKNQAWNTSSSSNIYNLAQTFGLDASTGYEDWCYPFSNTPNPPSGGQYYNSPSDVGAWGWCGGSAFSSGGFVCIQAPPPGPTCSDGVQNQGETGVDCGGPCGVCPTCNDGIQNQGEGGVDCGGPCAACPTPAYGDWLVGTACNGTDYGGGCTPQETGYHYRGNFNGYACWWHTKNQAWNTSSSSNIYNLAQTFGLNAATAYEDWCYPFANTPTPPSGGQYYNSPNDVGAWGWCGGSAFSSGGFVCMQLPAGPPSCNDGIQNQGESGVDCGGPCGACPTCNDGIQNQGEGAVDCGGPCAACPSCNDGVQNQGESGVDCGGPCGACPTCNDGIQNGGESGVDCGGSCAACPPGSYADWLVGTPCNGVDYGGGCTPQETGYHYKGYYNGYACWWHTKNQAWNTSSSSNIYNLAQTFGLNAGTAYEDWCYPFSNTPNPPSGGQYYNSSGDVGAWGWCGGSAFSSGGFVCMQAPPPGGATCNDGVQNQGETGIDCGGPCAACQSGQYGDWLVGTACNGVDYGGGCTSQETGYHYYGAVNGYQCWWHTKNQAWNTSSNTNLYNLATHFGLNPATGLESWCYPFASVPSVPSGYGAYYNSSGDIGAWGWCGGSPFSSGGFACFQ